MIKALTKHGNSLALVIEKPVLELIGADAETQFDISTDGQVLILTPVTSAIRRDAFKLAQRMPTVNAGGLLLSLGESTATNLFCYPGPEITFVFICRRLIMIKKVVFGVLVLIIPGFLAGATFAQQQQNQDMNRYGGGMQQGEAADEGDSHQEAVNAVQRSIMIVQQMVKPEKGGQQRISDQVMRNAEGIIIIPEVIKAGLVVGGRHGTGVLLSKQDGGWSPPVFVSISGISLGPQVGVQSSDLIMVFNNRETIQDLLAGGEFEVGADASAAAGNIGATAQATTRDAEILTYQHTEGLFAGVSLTGSVLNIDEEPTIAFYGLDQPQMRGYYADGDNATQKILNPNQTGQEQLVQNMPQSANQLQQALDQFTSNRQSGKSGQ